MAVSIDLAIGSSGGGGGSLSSGFLQVSGGVPLDATLRTITDKDNNVSPLRLSTGETSVSSYLSIGNAVNATGFGQRLRVIGQGDASIGVYRNQASSSPAKFEFMKSRGTYDVPLVVNNLDELGSLSYFGFNGTSYSNSARIYARAVSSTGTGVEGELLTTLWNNTGGNLNMLRLTISGLGIGNALDYTPSARLHVRGDGTNPILRTEDNSGTLVFSVNNTNIFCARPLFIDSLQGYSTGNITLGATISQTLGTTNTTTGLFSNYSISSSFAVPAGSANYRPLSIAYTINNTGVQTGTATGIFLNATETNLNGMGHNLMDLQVGAASRFRVSRDGQITIGSLITFANGTNISTSFNGIIRISNDSGVDFNRLQLGGTTNAFPAIKRETTAIGIRLADDSAYTFISASGLANGNLTTNFLTFVGNGMRWQQNGSAGAWSNDIGFHVNIQAQSNTTGYNNNLGVTTAFNAAAGAGNFQPLRVAYTINTTGAQTGTATGIFLNAVETALNGMTHNLIDLQVGGSSRFSVANNGTVTTAGAFNATSFAISGGGSYSINTGGNGGRLYGTASGGGGFLITNLNLTGALFLQLGGTTNAFPAIKRNGAGIEFRLADDSAVTAIYSRSIGSSNGAYVLSFNDNLTFGLYNQAFARHSWNTYNGSAYTEFMRVEGSGNNGVRSLLVGTTTIDNSAVVNLVSTTQGFLPPRQSTTQRNAIVSPTKGLIVFDTDVNKLFVFSGATWEEITSV